MPLEDIFKFVEAKDSGKSSVSKLLDSHSADAAGTDIRRLPRDTLHQVMVTPEGMMS